MSGKPLFPAEPESMEQDVRYVEGREYRKSKMEKYKLWDYLMKNIHRI